MNVNLLKHVGNIDQIAGVREAKLLQGRGEGVRIAEFYNVAGLRFSVVPDRGMDLYDLSYKGINLSFMTKNGITSPFEHSTLNGEFPEHWSAGALVTCGLDNVGGPATGGGNSPTHGRLTFTPAKEFNTSAKWDGDTYVLSAEGEVHQSCLFGRHLGLRRKLETGLNDKVIRIHDTVTNYEAQDEPFMLLYHINFGYPLLQGDSQIAVSKATTSVLSKTSTGFTAAHDPKDGIDEELYLHRMEGDRAVAVLYNLRLGIGVYVAHNTDTLPNMLEWKCMRSHDYALGLEPCNTYGINRDDAIAQNKIAIVPAYGQVDTHLEIGVLDGKDEIEAFLKTI